MKKSTKDTLETIGLGLLTAIGAVGTVYAAGLEAEAREKDRKQDERSKRMAEKLQTRQVMNSTHFGTLIDDLRSCTFDHQRVRALKYALRSSDRYFSAKQLAKILKAFDHDTNRLEAVELIANRVASPVSTRLDGVFDFYSHRMAALEMIVEAI